jgi:DnaJ homolog subfamily C member 28
MNAFDWISEERIRAAMEEGKFDNLPGYGKPLNLDDNPFEPEDMRMANSLLRSNEFTPPWMEFGKEIDRDLETARKRCVAGVSVERERALAEFSITINALNRRIIDYNLRVPAAVFQRTMLDLQKEIDSIINA